MKHDSEQSTLKSQQVAQPAYKSSAVGELDITDSKQVLMQPQELKDDGLVPANASEKPPATTISK